MCFRNWFQYDTLGDGHDVRASLSATLLCAEVHVQYELASLHVIEQIGAVRAEVSEARLTHVSSVIHAVILLYTTCS